MRETHLSDDSGPQFVDLWHGEEGGKFANTIIIMGAL